MTPVYFIAARGMVLLDLAGPAEAFRSANLFAPDTFRLHFCALRPDLETGIAGLHLSRLAPFPKRLPAGALVIVPGLVGDAPDWDDPGIQAIVRWLKGLDDRDDITIMSVCAGALLAAAAGLLRGRECTSHHSCLEDLAKLEPTAHVHDNRIFVQDGSMFTSAGITAGIDLALHFVARFCGPQVASATARHMVVYLRRTGQDPALSPWMHGRNHLHPGVHRAQDAVIHNPAAPWTASLLAEQAHISPRHLNRLFAEHVGSTPLEYLTRIRLTLAGELLRETRLDMERIAERAGFSSAHHLRRTWKKYATALPARPIRAHRPQY